jgi:hypothetical protein
VLETAAGMMGGKCEHTNISRKQEVNKIKISRMLIVGSPCCTAPSTTMNTVKSDARSKNRRCIRCRQVFCRIAVDQEEIMRVGASA